MYRIAKRFEFSASHILNGLPEGHQCGRLHGHNYVVEIELESSVLDETGFVQDYGELTTFRMLVESLDHRHLNDILPTQPSAENLAKWLFDSAHSVGYSLTSAVRVSETPKTWAEYRPPFPDRVTESLNEMPAACWTGVVP